MARTRTKTEINFQEAIKIVREVGLHQNPKEILSLLLRIAEQNPSALVEAQTYNLTSEESAIQMVTQELREGRKIQAIKEYRDLTRVGIKNAKDFVDGIEHAMKAVGDKMTGKEKQEIIAEIDTAIAAADIIAHNAYEVSVINAVDAADASSVIDIALGKAKNLINQVNLS